VDYVQTHVYSNDLSGAIARAIPASARKLDRPTIISEFGPADSATVSPAQLRAGLWMGLIAGGSGAAQYWDWETAEKAGMYDGFKSASAFVTASSLASHVGSVAAPAIITSSQKGTLLLTPGGDVKAGGTSAEFVVGSEGAAGIEKLSPVVASHGTPIKLQLNCEKPTSVSVALAEVAGGGAKLRVSVDGNATEREVKGGTKARSLSGAEAIVSVQVPAGAHTVLVENIGADWVRVQHIAVSDYAPALAGSVRVSKDFAAAYVYARDYAAGQKTPTPCTGTLKVTGLQKGKYKVTWWDTSAGKSLDSTEVESTGIKEEVAVTTPPISTDAALYIVKAGAPAASNKAKNTRAKVSRTPDRNSNKAGNPPSAAAAAPPTDNN
jgi:hypothetical protein